ncbi:MAG: hypothetical protein Kow0099_27610 [Candidatus Abyssubacteria bacterium]
MDDTPFRHARRAHQTRHALQTGNFHADVHIPPNEPHSEKMPDFSDFAHSGEAQSGKVPDGNLYKL